MTASAFAPTDVRYLIDRLTTGTALVSLDDWIGHLGDTPAAQRYVAALRQEWQPLTVPNEFCQQMLDFVRTYMSERHKDWTVIFSHTLRVTGVALALAPEAEIEPARAFLLGIFHDIGKLDEINGSAQNQALSHEEIGGQWVHKKLADVYPRPAIEQIARAVDKTAPNTNPYARILHNADKLDKIGATGILRRVSTDFGSQQVLAALRRVRADWQSFPQMNYPTSQRLATLKKEFTGTFLSSANSTQDL